MADGMLAHTGEGFVTEMFVLREIFEQSFDHDKNIIGMSFPLSEYSLQRVKDCSLTVESSLL